MTTLNVQFIPPAPRVRLVDLIGYGLLAIWAVVWTGITNDISFAPTGLGLMDLAVAVAKLLGAILSALSIWVGLFWIARILMPHKVKDAIKAGWTWPAGGIRVTSVQIPLQDAQCVPDGLLRPPRFPG
jgi:hypothetical protein